MPGEASRWSHHTTESPWFCDVTGFNQRVVFVCTRFFCSTCCEWDDVAYDKQTNNNTVLTLLVRYIQQAVMSPQPRFNIQILNNRWVLKAAAIPAPASRGQGAYAQPVGVKVFKKLLMFCHGDKVQRRKVLTLWSEKRRKTTDG